MRKTLPKRTKYYFDQFAKGDAKNLAHHLDAKRFYHFIHAAHQGRTKLMGVEVEEILLEHGFTKNNAEYCGEIYDHGRNLLKSRVAFNYNDKWKKQ
jgi:hypothetical protein